MTDEQKPGTEPAAIGDDETTRTPVTPPSPAAPAPAVPPMTPAWDPVSADPTGTPAWTPVAPTAPLTPAGRTSSADPLARTMSPGRLRSGRREWRSLRPSPRRSRALGGRPRDRRPHPRHDGGRRRDHHRPIGRLDRHRLRPGEHHDVHGGPARPARRPAPGHRRVPPEVPGLQRPGRARHQARRGPRRPGPRRDRQPADLHRRHQAVVRRRARVQHGTAAARSGPQGSGQVDRRLPCPGPGLDQGSGRRAGVARRRS